MNEVLGDNRIEDRLLEYQEQMRRLLQCRFNKWKRRNGIQRNLAIAHYKGLADLKPYWQYIGSKEIVDIDIVISGFHLLVGALLRGSSVVLHD